MDTPNNPLTREFQRKLDRLHSFGELVEKTLVSQLGALHRDLSKKSRSFSKEERLEFFEYHAEDYMELSDQLPTVLRYSVLTAADTALEVYMNDTCDMFARVTKAGVRVNDLKGSGIQRARQYLKKAAAVSFPDPDPKWASVQMMHALRNSIVHSDGVVDVSREDLKRWAKNVTGLRISDDGVINLDQGFIRPALDLYEAFVVEVDTACAPLGLWADVFPIEDADEKK